jgi:serine/threonine protein kinase
MTVAPDDSFSGLMTGRLRASEADAARVVFDRYARRLIGQVARALVVAHEAGVVHRDIKPDNIMVRDDGYVKVVDFGLARRLPALLRGGPEVAPGAAPDFRGDTDPGAFLGTVAYLSPEQARGEPVDRPSDVFSLGIVLYQMATGQHPFPGHSSLEVLQAITSAEPVPPLRLSPDIPAALEGLILAMLHLRGRAEEARPLLAGVCGWFKDEARTHDLQEARGLLGPSG